jgi:hypothetical protein
LVLGAIVGAVALATVGVLVSKEVRVANLKRFHLGTKNYCLWAAHQAVPSMYNFENRILLSNVVNEEGSFDPNDLTLVSDTINHFPARRITFGNYRMRQFKDHDQVMFLMSSRFGGERLETLWQVERERTDESDRLVTKRIKETLFIDSETD